MTLSLPAQKTSLWMPHSVWTPNGPPVHDSSGYDASAATAWPGSSISGMTSIWRAAANAMISLTSAWV